jgi:ABC-2 type transport system ATP-binding protein
LSRPAEAVLEVTGARKSYGATEALRGADLRLERGEWLSLLGRPLSTSGGVSGDVRDRLGVVPQDLALYPRLTARENLEVFGALQGLSGALLKERCEWALQFTALADRAAEPAGDFSGGMKRRLNIACGVLHKPDVVLLDEPTVGVDPQSRERIYGMLDELRAAGASLLMTTHQLDEVQQHSERIVIIDHGRVIAEGTVEGLIARTLGEGRTVVFRLDQPAPPALRAIGEAADGTTLRCAVRNMDVELPEWLSRLSAAQCRILDLSVEAPTLHAVFLHLTGRELRE